MAHFIGIAGDFQKEKALNRRLDALLCVFVGTAVFCFAIGFVAGRNNPWFSSIAVVATVVLYRIFTKLFDKQLRQARSEEDGADGEREIIPYLRNLPDSFTVVSDLDFADSYGNIDHLVIGPTGAYAIDVKNWKGNVTSDGKGELLLNGRPTDKPQIRYFTRRTMELKGQMGTVLAIC